jgi:hypothetical protein
MATMASSSTASQEVPIDRATLPPDPNLVCLETVSSDRHGFRIGEL